MNNNGTLLSHLLNIVLWQFSNVKKVSKKYMLLNGCEIFYCNCFRLNCSQIIRWGGMGNAISHLLFPWWGVAGEGFPSTDQEGDSEAEHLLITFGCQGRVIPLAGDRKVSAWSFLTNTLWSSQASRFRPSSFLELLVSRMGPPFVSLVFHIRLTYLGMFLPTVELNGGCLILK